MSIAFYMDENVHRGITNGLRIRDVDVLTVQEDGRTGFRDPVILDRATELKRVLFTQDDDFLAEATRRQLESLNQLQLSVASIKASRIPGSLIE